MSQTETLVDDRLASLARADIRSLRAQWADLYGRPAPMRLSCDLLARAIAYRIQAEQWGGLRPALRRRLERLGEGGECEAARRSVSRLQPGARLMREWNGETHVVEVLADGLAWNGERYRSLSAVARAITGVRWSGPRFFGLHEAARSSNQDQGTSP